MFEAFAFLASTLAVEAGVTARVGADALGHQSFKTTAQSYAKPEAVSKAKPGRVLQVPSGGKVAAMGPRFRSNFITSKRKRGSWQSPEPL